MKRRDLTAFATSLFFLALAVPTAAALTGSLQALQAVPLAQGEGTLEATGTISPAGTADVYALRLRAGDRALLSVTATGSTPLVLKLLPPSATTVTATPLASISGPSPMTLNHQASVPGTYYPVLSTEGPPLSYTLSYRRLRSTSLSVLSPGSVAYGGGTARISARITDSDGQPVNTGKVAFYYSYDKVRWQPMSTVPVDEGVAKSSIRVARRTFFRARYTGAGDLMSSGFSMPSQCAPRFYLTAPNTPVSATPWKAFSVTGIIKPAQPSGSQTVAVRAYRLEAGKWAFYKAFKTTNRDCAGGSVYSASISLPGSGPARWRIVAYRPGDARYAATTSAPRYIDMPMMRFRQQPFPALNVPAEQRPFFYLPQPKIGPAYTVIKRYINGVAYDFATAQAETGYRCVNYYIQTGDEWYLQRAKAQADRLIQVKRAEGDGWFFPNAFDYRVTARPGGNLVGPWYSGLSQGAVVGFLARLYEVTGERVYGDAAEHALESMLIRSRSGRPWCATTDRYGYLVFEEYPNTPLKFVLNGHMEAAVGLYDYYMVTGDPRAAALYRGALTTVAKYGESFRTPGWVSVYSLGVRSQFAGYHRHHIDQLLQLFAYSGDIRFAHLANDFYDDYRTDSIARTITVVPGTHRLYRFGQGGEVVSSRVLEVAESREISITARARIKGRPGHWYRIAKDGLSDYYIAERPSKVFLPGLVAALRYPRPVNVQMNAGTWSARHVDASGTATPSGEVTITTPTSGAISERGVLDGAHYVHITTGPAPGKWLPISAVKLP